MKQDLEDKASIRENEIIEADGTKAIELDVYCPGCKKWSAVLGRRRASWAERTLRSFAARPFLRSARGEARLADIMNRDVICVRPDMSIEALSAMFLEREINGAPVLDRAGKLIGVVGTADILRNAWDPPVWGEGDPPQDGTMKKGFHLEPLPRATVAEIMSPIVFKLSRDASVFQAAALMAYESVQRIIVVTPDGKVEGLVSGEDVLRWVAHTAGYAVPTTSDPLPPKEEPVRLSGPILIVDDDDDLRQTVAELLQSEGYAVMTACNGAEALVALQLSARPALILLDLAMPVMNGSTLCAELSKDPNLDRIPLVLLSGSDRLAKEVGRIDADAFLSKPVEAKRLLGTIRRYC